MARSPVKATALQGINRAALKSDAESKSRPILPGQRYVTLEQAGVLLGVTPRTIRQMIADGRLTGYRNGRRLVRLKLDEIDAAMEAFGGAA